MPLRLVQQKCLSFSVSPRGVSRGQDENNYHAQEAHEEYRHEQHANEICHFIHSSERGLGRVQL